MMSTILLKCVVPSGIGGAAVLGTTVLRNRPSTQWSPIGSPNGGPMGPWANGPMGTWAHGPMGPWAHGPMGPWAYGPMGPWGLWAHGAHGPMGHQKCSQLRCTFRPAPTKVPRSINGAARAETGVYDQYVGVYS